MSWDVSIINFSKEYKSIDEIPDNEKPLDLGSREYVHEAILEFFPATNWSDPSWGGVDSKFGSIEFNLGNEDPSPSMMLHVRASKEVVAPIIMLCKKHNWSALDCSNGDLLEHSKSPASGLDSWRNYLSQIIHK